MRKPIVVLLTTAFALAALALAQDKDASCGAEIVAEKSFTHQTAPFSPTIFTPAADGTYRISLYVEMFGSQTTTTFLTSLVTWTDDVGPVSQTSEAEESNPPLACGVTGPVSRCDAVGIMRVKANTPIGVDFLNVAVSPGGSYNAYVVLEKMNKGERCSD